MIATTELNRTIAQSASTLTETANWGIVLEFRTPEGPVLETMELSLPVGMTPHDLLISDFASDVYGTPTNLQSDYRGIPRPGKDD